MHPFELWNRFDGRGYGFTSAYWIVPRREDGRVIIEDATVPLFPSQCRKVSEAPSVFGPMPVKSAKAGTC